LLALLVMSACQPIQPPATSDAATSDAATNSGTAGAGDAGAAEAALNEVTFTAVEYSFDAPTSIPAGWTRVTLDNQGELMHDLLLFKIEEGRTMDDVMAALEAEGPPEWAEFYGSSTATGGASNWFASNLTPGNYVYLSFGSSEQGPPDAAQGMIGELTVTEADTPAAADAPIEADASVEMVDFQFVVNGPIQSGEQVLRLTNTGAELHEMVVFKLHEGKTMADFQAVMEREMSGETVPQEELPGDFVTGAYLSPGLVSYWSHTFEPGNYILLCFVPSPQNDMLPHVALGMIQEVTVE
jgi:hypothetical protein